MNAHARRLAERLGIAWGAAEPEAAGRLAALAWPDRIAMRRPGAYGRFLLASGRGAFLPEADMLAGAPLLAVAAVDGGERETRIHLAAPLDSDALEEVCAVTIRQEAVVEWDERASAVIARRRRRLGALVLEDAPLDRPDPEAVTAALLQGIRAAGLGCLPWTREAVELRDRVAFLRRIEPEGGWPDWSDASLLATLEHWLGPFVGGMSRLAHLARLDLAESLGSVLSWPLRRSLDELAPTHIAVPSGSHIRIDYESGETPVLAVRIQELFGLTETPHIAGGVPLLLHLLSPARRPVQVTQDLAGFWRGAWVEVKKELKGRYPKHHWPDDPLAAVPTARAKPRG